MEQPISSLPLPAYKIQQLQRLGYFYVKDIDFSDEKLKTYIEQNELEEMIKTSVTKNALDLYREEVVTGNILTLIKSLDDMLGNGVPLKQITEFCGPPGSGKSQICYQLCINVQLPFWCGGVDGESIYLCTKYGFNSGRLKEMAIKSVENYEAFKSKSTYKFQEININFNVTSILKKIHFMQLDNDVELMAAVNCLQRWLECSKKVHLVIIDSITAPIRFAEMDKRTEIINIVLRTLKVLVQKFDIAIVLTNEMTTKIYSNAEIKEVPAFGNSYFHKINTRMQLSKMHKDTFKAALIKSTFKPYTEVEFQLPN